MSCWSPDRHVGEGLAKRLLQLQSLASTRSCERRLAAAPEMQRALDRVLRAKRFDLVNLEFSFLGECDLRQAPPNERLPRLVVDSHNIDYELARQYARAGRSLAHRLYAGVNWRKLRREELGTYRDADGVYLCSAADERRLLDEIPGARTAVIPNAADVEYYQPRPTDPPPDGRTVVFFGHLSYAPNVDGVIYFVQEIWPRIAEAHPEARLKIIGGRPPRSLQLLAGPRVELTGFVPDLRPHLAAAAAVVVPLRLGGGTRLKIVEAMAMGKAIVSTPLGAEGIEAVPGRDLLIEDQPEAFADAVNRLLGDPELAARIGQSARGWRWNDILERGRSGAGGLLSSAFWRRHRPISSRDPCRMTPCIGQVRSSNRRSGAHDKVSTGVRRRIDIEPDNGTQFVDGARVIGKFEPAQSVRLEPVRAARRHHRQGRPRG